MENDRILGYFLEEASEHLNTIEQGLRKLPETIKQPTLIRELFRSAHSIGGSAAMLGLLDVQKIGKQFEANFKLLKEQPEITVDTHLQSLFLESFSFLQASINNVRESSDPYRQNLNAEDPIGDPVFAELKAHLQHLLTSVTPAPVAQNRSSNMEKDPAIEQIFGEYVTSKLEDILTLCLQPDRLEVRTEIQQICQKLGSLGENFEFLEWTNLFTACRLAIANPDNYLPQLGESISIAVKQAQILILADRHQSIGVTPDLEALINRHNSPTARLDRQATEKNLPNLLSIDAGIVSELEPISALPTDLNDNLTDGFALSDTDFDPDVMELNEFVNLIGNDLPSEGTWMQDNDSFDCEIGLEDLGNSVGDLIDRKIFQPVSSPNSVDLVVAISENISITSEQESDETIYDEETFYDPNREDIDDRDIPSFWLDPQLAAPPQPLIEHLDLLDNIDRQLQPDLSPDLDLDVPVLDFSLDSPMSGIFPTIAPSEDWAELEESQPLSLEMTSPIKSISNIDFISFPDEFTQFDLDSLDYIEPVAELTVNDDFANLEVESIEQFTSNSDIPDLGVDLLDNDLDIFNNIEPVAELTVNDDFANLEVESIEQFTSNSDIPDLGVDLLDNDLDIFNNIEPVAELTVNDDFANLEVESIEQFTSNSDIPDLGVDLLDNDLDIFNNIEPVAELAVNDDFVNLEVESIEQFTSNSDIPDLGVDLLDNDLDIFNNIEPVAELAVNDDFVNLEVESIEQFTSNSDIPDLGVDLLGNDLDIFNNIEPVAELAVNDDFVNLEVESIEQFTSNSDIPDLGVDLLDNDLDIFNNIEPVAELAVNDDFVNLEVESIEQFTSNSDIPDLGVDLLDNDLDIFGNIEPVAELAVNDDFVNLEVESIEQFTSNSDIPDLGVDLLDNDLDIFNNIEPVAELAVNDDFVNLEVESIEQFTSNSDIPDLGVDLLDNDLDIFNNIEPVAELAVNDDFVNLEVESIEQFTSNSDIPDLGVDLLDNDLDIFGNIEPVAELAVNDDFVNLEVESIEQFTSNSDIPDLGVDLLDNDLDIFGNIEPVAELAVNDDFVNLEVESIEQFTSNSDIPDLGVDLLDNDLDIFNNIEPVAELTVNDDFVNLNVEQIEKFTSISESLDLGLDFLDSDLDILNSIEPIGDLASLNIEQVEQFTNISESQNLGLDFLDSNLDIFDSIEPIVDVAANDDFAKLDIDRVAQITSNINFTDLDLDLLDSDLDILNNIEPIGDVATDCDLTNLDLNVLNLDNLKTNSGQSSEFEDLSELDFNLDDLSTDLASDESIDLGSLLDDRSTSNLNDLGDLDALLAITALGVGGAILASENSAFDDLDALFDSDSIANPTANLDDLDLLLAPPAPVVKPPVDNTDNKPKDRRAKQSRTFEQTMRVSVRHLDNLNNLVGELVVNRNTLEQDQNRMRQFVEKLLSEVQKLNEVGKRMQDLYERSLMENSLVASRQQYKPIVPNNSANNDDAGGDTLMEYDPLEMDRFTPIHLLSQKMIELTVRVRESTADIEFVVDGSTEVTRTLRQITGQLQEDLTKSRMLPFAQTADRLQRGVRDNGLKYGKQIELSIEGRDTLIDKVILESLSEPLIHMVNNAIAHGIESGETRQDLGKSIEGKITIRALHQGNQTIISISDDGAGIDTERVKTKAIEKGVITRQQAATMSKNEIYELLFLPSFSTKDKADELSGRGVGMDVVKTSITEIRGTISTESQMGIGTTFTIRLPLALSIAKALIAVNNKCNIAFPMDGIEDTQDISPEQIQTNSNGEQCIFWRDELMPFKPLSDLLGFNRPLARNNFYSTHEDDSDLVSILILRSDGNLIAVQVDKIDSDREIVIKPLQGPASKPLGIAGATVMGDGRIIPIADVMELIALAKGTLARHISPQWTAQMTAPTVEVRESMVLIVDDSITVRELLSLTFKRAGYRVEQARDGQEAWDKLRAGLPCDIVFCDIEMPRMDGLEFLSRIQKDVALSKVPVAMLTSRGSDRHRQIAAQLGASGYFIKPYLEEALLEAAKRMIGGEVLQIV